MNTFTKSNTVEAYLYDLISAPIPTHKAVSVREAPAGYTVNGQAQNQGQFWQSVNAADLPRQTRDVLVEPMLREALARLNPAIKARPELADEVLYRLRAIILSVRSDGLIKANEEFTTWLRGERSMSFGPNHEHRTVHLVDFDNLDNNRYVVTRQYSVRAGPAERRADLVLLVNGFPLVLIETKTPVRPSVSWVDGALQVHDDYERYVPGVVRLQRVQRRDRG